MLLFIIIPASFAPRFVNFNTSHVTVYHKGTQLRKEQTKNFNTSHVTVYRRHTGNDHPVSEFQYISCYCLSVVQHLFDCFFFISIHLMLLFILLPHLPHVFLRIISIHLMLLFILVLPQGSPFVLHFNTSHVTVYHGAQSNIVSIHADFNTSHVTVYRLFNIFSIASSSFQYISCYCLSITGKEMIHTSINFNTSHVTVYRYRVANGYAPI